MTKKKTALTILRQGDVLLIRTSKSTKGLKRVPREGGLVILARGEATNHHHSIPSAHCALYLDEQRPRGLIPDRVLKVSCDVQLFHQEHDQITVPRGSWVVRIQREYSPRALRNVAD